jgi:LemA protein
MSSDLAVVGALAAMLIFWMVGAHNRITALRNALHAAWPPLNELLDQRAQTLGGLADTLRAWPGGDASPAQPLQAALAQVRSACASVRTRPSHRDAVAGLGAAEAALAPVLERTRQWIETDAADAAEARPHLATLDALVPRLDLARQAFNQAATAYNQAVGQFPTSLLAPLLRMHRAGTF